MAKYTMELRKIQARFYEAMQDYPIFDESYRETLNDKIYHACKMREIGFETPELFLEQLAYWMDLHMPEFNWLYKANLVELTPLQRTQIMETMNRIKNYNEQNNSTENKTSIKDYDASTKTDTLNQNSSNTNLKETSQTDDSTQDTGTTINVDTDTSESKSFHSDFPQANIGQTDDSNYYTTGERDNSQSESKGTENTQNSSIGKSVGERENNQLSTQQGSQNTNQVNKIDDTTTSIGKSDDDKVGEERETEMKSKLTGDGYSDFELLDQYRKSFVNVDNRIIRALKKDLFMNIW